MTFPLGSTSKFCFALVLLALGLQCGEGPLATLRQSSPCADLAAGSICSSTTNGLNIRSEPGLSAPLKLSASLGMEFKYALDSQQQDGHCWLKLETNLGMGWASNRFLSCRQLGVEPKKPSHILYPGDAACGGGCERGMTHPEIEIPQRNGLPWGDTYMIGANNQQHLAGYSSGRIALLRRLGLRKNGKWAIMIDPSWEDNARDFLSNGQLLTGDQIVKTWLQGDNSRRFLLLYSTSSAGWQRYQSLRTDPSVGNRVKVCSVPYPHLEIPRKVGPTLILDPAGFKMGTCSG